MFVYVPPPHTKEVLPDVLMDFLLDWNMDRKVSTFIVDNCSSNDGMINILVEKFESIVAITTNMWISNQKKAYMAITVHYIDESWLLQHHILRLVMFFF